MPGSSPRLLRRLAGAAAASGLALAGLVVAAAPASAAACSGTSGVTVVVDTGSSISTKCASGDPSSAIKALTGAGFSVTSPQQFPGSVVCRINGFPESDPCVRMPPADAYWAFFHAKRGGSWSYSQSGAGELQPGAGHGRGLPLRVRPAAARRSTGADGDEPACPDGQALGDVHPEEDDGSPEAVHRGAGHPVDVRHHEHRVDAGDGGAGVGPGHGERLAERLALPQRDRLRVGLGHGLRHRRPDHGRRCADLRAE